MATLMSFCKVAAKKSDDLGAFIKKHPAMDPATRGLDLTFPVYEPRHKILEAARRLVRHPIAFMGGRMPSVYDPHARVAFETVPPSVPGLAPPIEADYEISPLFGDARSNVYRATLTPTYVQRIRDAVSAFRTKNKLPAGGASGNSDELFYDPQSFADTVTRAPLDNHAMPKATVAARRKALESFMRGMQGTLPKANAEFQLANDLDRADRVGKQVSETYARIAGPDKARYLTRLEFNPDGSARVRSPEVNELTGALAGGAVLANPGSYLRPDRRTYEMLQNLSDRG